LQILNKEKKSNKVLRILLLVLGGALGVWILVNPIIFEGFYQIVIGIIIAANALKDLVTAIRENKHWIFTALAILSLVFGVIVMCNPFTLFRTFAIISGIALIFSAIVSIVNVIKSGKNNSEAGTEQAAQ